MLQDCKRNFTVNCKKEAIVYCFDCKIFREQKERLMKIKTKELMYLIETVHLLKCLNLNYKKNLIDKLILKKFVNNEIIIKKDQIGDILYILKEGCVVIMDGDVQIRKLFGIDHFGEYCILIENKRTMDVYSFEDSICYYLTNKDIEYCLGVNYKEIILFSFFKTALSSCSNNILNELFVDNQLYDLFKCFKLYKYSKDERMMLEEKICLVIQGSIIDVNKVKIIIIRLLVIMK